MSTDLPERAGDKRIAPLDPDSPAGRTAAEALSQVLAEIQVAIWQRESAAQSDKGDK